MAVYILHSTHPLGRGGRAGAQHYVGYARRGAVMDRVRDHQTGKSDVPIVHAFLKGGGKLYLGAVLPDATREDERRIKVNGHIDRLCRICQGKGAVPVMVQVRLV